MASARRRRLRTASLTTGLGASLALVVPLVLGGGGQTLLVPQPDPQQPAVTVSHVPAPDQGRHGVPNVVHTVTWNGTAPAAGPGSTSAQTSAGAPVSPPTAAGASGSHAKQPAGAKPYAAGPLQRDDQSTYVPLCLNADQPAKKGLCSETSLASQGTPHDATLNADVCNLDARAATLRFAGANEVDLTVLDAHGHQVWRWSHWHADRSAPHTLVVPAGGCTFWSFAWTEVDFRGRVLPAGSYTLRADFLSGGLPAATWSFTLS